jgi:hypothetical protein
MPEWRDCYSPKEAQIVIELWRVEYNTRSPLDQTPISGAGLLAAFKLHVRMNSGEKEAEPEPSVSLSEALAPQGQEAQDGSIPEGPPVPADTTHGEGQEGEPELQTPDSSPTVQ